MCSGVVVPSYRVLFLGDGDSIVTVVGDTHPRGDCRALGDILP